MILPVENDNGLYRKFGKKYTEGFHNGHDFGVPENTPVKCVATGRVVFADFVNGFGSMYPHTEGGVVIVYSKLSNAHSIYCLYGHIKNMLKKEYVNEGDEIGRVINFTSYGESLPHLHFAIWNKTTFPPYPWGYVDDLKDWVDPIKFIEERLQNA